MKKTKSAKHLQTTIERLRTLQSNALTAVAGGHGGPAPDTICCQYSKKGS